MTLNFHDFTNQPDDFSVYSDEISVEPEKSDTILIVDDEEVVRHFHLDCLSTRYNCIEAASAEEALDVLDEQRISLIITDWVMPGMSGTTLLRHVVQHYPDTLVVMVTGVDHPERTLDAMHFGAFDYLLKPMSPDKLDFTVARAIRHRDLMIKTRQLKTDLELQRIEFNRQKSDLERLQVKIVQSEEMAAFGQRMMFLSDEIDEPLNSISENLKIVEQYHRDLRKLLAVYESVDLPSRKAKHIKEFREQINYSEVVENFDTAISTFAVDLAKISRLVQDLDGSAANRPVYHDL